MNLVGLPQALLWMALIAIVFSSLGTAIGSRLENMQGFQMVMNFLVMPLFFLSGALYPLTGLPAALRYITGVNPLSYGVDGLRSALIGVAHFAPLTDLTVLAAFAVVFVIFGAWSFSRIEL
jgi:ABC-2 type transport system permease protein